MANITEPVKVVSAAVGNLIVVSYYNITTLTCNILATPTIIFRILDMYKRSLYAGGFLRMRTVMHADSYACAKPAHV